MHPRKQTDNARTYSLSILSNASALPAAARVVPSLVLRRCSAGHCADLNLTTYVMNTTSHFPSFRPASSIFSKSITFCSTLLLAPPSWSAGVTRRPYSPTREKSFEARSSFKRCFPVAPVAPMINADFADISQEFPRSNTRFRREQRTNV